MSLALACLKLQIPVCGGQGCQPMTALTADVFFLGRRTMGFTGWMLEFYPNRQLCFPCLGIGGGGGNGAVPYCGPEDSRYQDPSVPGLPPAIYALCLTRLIGRAFGGGARFRCLGSHLPVHFCPIAVTYQESHAEDTFITCLLQLLRLCPP